MRAARTLTTLTSLLAAAVACGGDAGRASAASVRATGGAQPSYEVDVVATGLVVPWDLEFAPDGRIFLTERPGRIRVIENGRLRDAPWATLDVVAAVESGLMGIALAPDFATSGAVYVVGTFAGEDGNLENRVVRLTERDGRGVDARVVIAGLPAARIHAGSALDFGPDGMLYVTVGDATEPRLAQVPEARHGKLLRYRPDGGIPADNPTPGSPVWALGLRNPEGLDWDPGSGALFASEHGPSGLPWEEGRRGHDELNHVTRWGNYGWPAVAGRGEGARFVEPLAVWTPAIAPAGIAIYSGPIAAWRGSAFLGGLRGRQLRRVGLERTGTGWRVVGQEALLENEYGRLRAVVMGPDGALYVTTSNRDGRGDPEPRDDMVLRLRAGR